MLEEVTYRRKLEFIVARTLPLFVLSGLMHLHSFYQTHALIELTFTGFMLCYLSFIITRRYSVWTSFVLYLFGLQSQSLKLYLLFEKFWQNILISSLKWRDYKFVFLGSAVCMTNQLN